MARFHPSPPSFALVSLVVEVLFCNQGVEVRFLPGAPVFLSEALSGCVHGLGPCGQGSNPCRETNFWGISIMGLRQLCKLFMGVRFSHSPPILWAISKMNITQGYEP